MNKRALTGGAIAVTGLLVEMAVHGYLDVMYKETIPPGIIKRIANRLNDAEMDEFGKYTEKNNEWVRAQSVENVSIINDRGFRLAGYILPAKVPTHKFVFFAHGYRADHEGDPINFERFYHEQGYNFVSVDHTTAGASEGDFVGFDYYESRDMLRWIDYLVERYGKDIEIILHGVSMGGATVCKMADSVPEQVRLIISDCAYTCAIDQFAHTAGGINKNGLIMKIFNGMNKAFAHYDLADTDVRQSVKNSRVPMLFVHGDADDFVPTGMVYELYDICESAKDLLIIRGAAHAQSVMVGTQEYFNKIKEFINNNIKE